MSLHKLWVANCSLASISATLFATVAAGLGSGLNKIVDQFRDTLGQSEHGWQVVQCAGVVPRPFHTQMSLHKLWVANCSLASTSAICFGIKASGLRFDVGYNVDLF